MTSKIPYISREQAEKLLTCFNEAIKRPKSNPLLFNVWGIGGVGKTTLLNRLEEQHSNISFARVYFGRTPDIDTPLKLMARLYSNLPTINDWGEDFERFTGLYQKYKQTLEQLKQPDKKENEAQATTRKDAIKKLVGGGAKIFSQVTPLKDIPGTEEKIGSMAEGGVDLVDWLQKQRVTKRDKELQSLMLEPIPKLTKVFVRGLVAKSQQQPVVLLLDTYEKTNSEIDNWLWQYLVADSELKSHSVRVVVAGRKNILKQESWRKLQQDFNSIYSLEIEKFTPEQTQNYLQDIGIEAAEAIYQVTKGLPYYLDWIRKQKLAGKQLDYSQGNQAIVNLLLQGLNKEQTRVIQLAACCRWFNKSLIKYLVTSQALDFNKGVDTELNCFEWLAKLDFVEFSQNIYRLDDVARDVFRLSLCQEDEEHFHQVNDSLAKYYEAKAIKQVPLDSSPRRIYENREWRKYTAESLYHTLFARQQNWETKLIAHLFTACYFQEVELVIIPFNAITAEINIEDEDNVLLSSAVKKFLQTIEPIFSVNCLAFEEQKLDNYLNYSNEYLGNYLAEELSSEAVLDRIVEEYDLQDQFDKFFAEYQIDDSAEKLIFKRKYIISVFQASFLEQVKTSLKPAREYCFERIDFLDGLAKFVGWLYQAEHCVSSYKWRYLQQAKSQAEQIIIDSDREFSSGLFLWGLGNALSKLGRLEEAIESYDKALEIKPDNDWTWSARGNALSDLGRLGEAIESWKKALALNPELYHALYNLACYFALQNKIQPAIENLAKAISLNQNCQEMAKTDPDFDKIRENSRFQTLIESD